MGRRSHTQKARRSARFAYSVADHLGTTGAGMVEGASDRIISIDAKNVCAGHRETHSELAWGFAGIYFEYRRRNPLAGPFSRRRRDPRPSIASLEISEDAAQLLRSYWLFRRQRCSACEDAKSSRAGTATAALAKFHRKAEVVWRDIGFALCRIADGIRGSTATGNIRTYMATGGLSCDFDSFNENKSRGLRGDARAVGGRFTGVETTERDAPGHSSSNPESQGD